MLAHDRFWMRRGAAHISPSPHEFEQTDAHGLAHRWRVLAPQIVIVMPCLAIVYAVFLRFTKQLMASAIADLWTFVVITLRDTPKLSYIMCLLWRLLAQSGLHALIDDVLKVLHQGFVLANAHNYVQRFAVFAVHA